MRTTPDNITELATGEVFVFGANTAGHHGAGAALIAKLHFGAKQLYGEGLYGNSYALPTLDWNGGQLTKRSHGELMRSITKFYRCALMYPKLTFLLTKVGCGLAGYDESYMKQFFRDTPPNVIKPEGW